MNFNDIGLKVLNWVKKVKGDRVDLTNISQTNTPILDHHLWSDLLKKNVTEFGQVDYRGIIHYVDIFQKYLDQISQNPPGNNWTDYEQLAYWINAYNAFTVKLVIDNYPLKSIKSIANGLPMVNSPWDIKFFKIGEVSFDLNTIEHEILRKKFNEPRIHFAINCASISCPRLRNEAYTAKHLDKQLDDQAKSFVNDSSKNIITTEKLQLSKLFDWFESDFIKRESLTEFIKKYKSIENIERIKIEYLEYDWNLNE